jgi:transcription-repair coupling factor (superfamily II helicase)
MNFLQNDTGISRWGRQEYLNKNKNEEEKESFSFAGQFKKITPSYTKIYSQNTQKTPTNDFKPSNTSELKAGQKVEHQKFGIGIVKELQNFQDDKKAVIQFAEFGEKTLLLSFAKLKILD